MKSGHLSIPSFSTVFGTGAQCPRLSVTYREETTKVPVFGSFWSGRRVQLVLKVSEPYGSSFFMDDDPGITRTVDDCLLMWLIVNRVSVSSNLVSVSMRYAVVIHLRVFGFRRLLTCQGFRCTVKYWENATSLMNLHPVFLREYSLNVPFLLKPRETLVRPIKFYLSRVF